MPVRSEPWPPGAPCWVGAPGSRGTVLMAPQDSPYGRVAVVADPWGARFALMVPAETA